MRITDYTLHTILLKLQQIAIVFCQDLRVFWWKFITDTQVLLIKTFTSNKGIEKKKWSHVFLSVSSRARTQTSLFGEEKRLTGLLSQWTVCYCWRPTVIIVTSPSAFSSHSRLIRPASWVMGLHWWNAISLGCINTTCRCMSSFSTKSLKEWPALSSLYVLMLYTEHSAASSACLTAITQWHE